MRQPKEVQIAIVERVASAIRVPISVVPLHRHVFRMHAKPPLSRVSIPQPIVHHLQMRVIVISIVDIPHPNSVHVVAVHDYHAIIVFPYHAMMHSHS